LLEAQAQPDPDFARPTTTSTASTASDRPALGGAGVGARAIEEEAIVRTGGGSGSEASAVGSFLHGIIHSIGSFFTNAGNMVMHEAEEVVLHYKINPYVGILGHSTGLNLLLGTPRSEVRSLIPCSFKASEAGSESISATARFEWDAEDIFEDACLRIIYDREEKCHSIEIYAPAPTYYEGTLLTNREFGKICEELLVVDPEILIDDEMALSRRLGFLVLADPLHTLKMTITVSVFTASFLRTSGFLSRWN